MGGLDVLDDLLLGSVVLNDEQGREESFKVVRVLEMNEQHYVLLQSLDDPGDDLLILRVEGDVESDDASLVGVDDDDEWEAVAEAFDELLFDVDED